MSLPPVSPPPLHPSAKGEGLWLVNADGSGLRRLTKYSGAGANWDHAGDGRVVHIETKSGVFLVGPDGSSRMVYACDGCSTPRFSRDGTRIAFIEADDRTSRIRVITTSGQTFALSQPRSLGCCIAWSPDGRRIAHFVFEGESGKDDVQLWTLADDSYEPVADIGAMFGSLDWSPDGRYMAWGEHTASVLDLRTRRVTTPEDGTRVDYADLSGDGRLVVGGNDISVIDVVKETYKVLVRDGTTPSWSPDNRYIAFARTARYGVGGFAERNLSVVPAKGGTIRTVVPIPLNHSIYDPRWSSDGTFLVFSVTRGYL